jgi:hypothetical protein
VREEKNARHESADPKDAEHCGQAKMQTAAVTITRKEHERHEASCRKRKTEVNRQALLQFLIAFQVIEYVWLDHAYHHFEPNQSGRSQNEKDRIEAAMNQVAAASQHDQRRGKDQRDTDYRDLEDQDYQGARQHWRYLSAMDSCVLSLLVL